jgi:uncharacterized protein (DUF1330 family)
VGRGVYSARILEREADLKYYAVVEMEITDPSWVESYVANVTPLVERHGGRYLARTNKVEKLEGERARPQIVTIAEWPSKEAADAFYYSEEYRPYREARAAGSKTDLLVIAGNDVTGRARIE